MLGWAARLACIVLLLSVPFARAAESESAIAAAHPLAIAAGRQMLEAGGNAFDAAVAVAAALGVVEPYSSGLGGGGFCLLHRASDDHDVMIDARETAPAGVRSNQYFDAQGRPIPGATTRGGTSVGIPGTPAALVHIAARYGTLPLGELLAPAIRLARDGFRIGERYARIARLRVERLRGTSAAAIFLDHGHAPAAGYLLRQPALAATLEAIAGEGVDGFYRGRIAKALLDAVNAQGGAWRLSDLAHYRVIERAPLKFDYRGARITTVTLPSAGGIAIGQALAMLERFELGSVEEPATAHLVVEALRRAFEDRARYLGDADFAAVPLARLLDRDYLAARSASIDPRRATPSAALPGAAVSDASGNTTHFSVIDAAGNRAACTVTINWLFGSGIVAGGTGVLLNNEMDDFTLRADVANSYKLRGGAANAMAPGKRPLSSMTPTFVEDSKGVLVVGSPGGSRIVSQVLLAVLEYVHETHTDLARIVGMPRYHHQYLPDRIEIEPSGFSDEWRAALEARGHKIVPAGRRWGNMQAVFKSRATGRATAASDPRGSGIAWY